MMTARLTCFALLLATVTGFFAPQLARAPRRSLAPLAATSEADLFDALTELSSSSSKSIVVKYGGHAMSDDAAAFCFAQDIVLIRKLGLKPVVVHGGGPQIGAMLKRLNATSTFIDGLRVTDAATLQISEMVLCGSINKQIASAMCQAGGSAIGLSGRDDSIITAEKKKMVKVVDGETVEVDLGFVGEPSSVNVAALNALLDAGIIPVIAPIAIGKDGQTYSVNADTAAGAVAAALGSARLLLLTDVTGVLDKSKTLISKLTPTEARALIADGTISAGMIPKIETAMEAVEAGCTGAAIVDGRVQHCVLRELTSGSSGTLVTAE